MRPHWVKGHLAAVFLWSLTIANHGVPYWGVCMPIQAYIGILSSWLGFRPHPNGRHFVFAMFINSICNEMLEGWDVYIYIHISTKWCHLKVLCSKMVLVVRFQTWLCKIHFSVFLYIFSINSCNSLKKIKWDIKIINNFVDIHFLLVYMYKHITNASTCIHLK